MLYRSIGHGVRLINSNFDSRSSVKPVLASEHLIRETLGIKVGEDVTLMNDDNIKYYSVLNKKGFGSWKSSTVHTLLYTFGGPIGALGSTAVDIAMGGKFKRQIVFIKLKDNHRVLIVIEDGYRHLLRSKKKVKKDGMDNDDLKWIEKSVEQYKIKL